MKRNLLLVLLLPALPGISAAADESPHGFSANASLTTDYVFRGITQTSHRPAVQAGVDYAHASGFYAGIWGSNVSWIADSGAVATGSARMELDTYFGLRNGLADDLSYDLGFIRYNYPGGYTPAAGFARADTDEIYGALGYKWLTAKYSYGLGSFLTVPGAAGTGYLELNANLPIAGTDATFGAHLGRQSYRGAAAAAFTNTPSYTDYRLSLSSNFGGCLVTLAYTGVNASPFYTYPAAGGDWGRRTLALSLSFQS